MTTATAPFSRAPKIKKAIPAQIRLSPEELETADAYAAAQDRSRSSFLRSMYLRGLKDFELSFNQAK